MGRIVNLKGEFIDQSFPLPYSSLVSGRPVLVTPEAVEATEGETLPVPKLGQTWLPAVSMDPTLMLMGIGGLVLAMFLLGGRPERQERKKKKKAAVRKKKVAVLRKEIEGIEAEE